MSPSCTEQVSLRPYQQDLVTQATNKNSIIFLDTGGGKTLVAANVIKHYLKSFVNKKVVFLVNHVHLIEQQTKELLRVLDAQVVGLSSKTGPSMSRPEVWQTAVKCASVLVIIHDIFLRALKLRLINMRELSLLVVDECHHTIKRSSYSKIFKLFYHPIRRQPFAPNVLGLSASLVASKCKENEFLHLKRELEKTLCAKVIMTSHTENLLDFVPRPRETIFWYDLKPSPNMITKALDKIINELQDTIQKTKGGKEVRRMIRPFKDCKRFALQLLRSILEIGTLAGRLFFEHSPLINLVPLQSQDNSQLAKVLVSLSQVRDMIENCLEGRSLKSAVEEFTTNKIHTLKNIIMGFEASSDMKAIVFVKGRQSAPILMSILQILSQLYPELSHIRAGYAMGANISDSFGKRPFNLDTNDAPESTIAVETVRKFRAGLLNMIVSTAVLEEGLDVQACNLVIRFDPMPDQRSYVQSRGRARAHNSFFAVMLNISEKDKHVEEYDNFKRIEEFSKEIMLQEHSKDNSLETEQQSLLNAESLTSLVPHRDMVLRLMSKYFPILQKQQPKFLIFPDFDQYSYGRKSIDSRGFFCSLTKPKHTESVFSNSVLSTKEEPTEKVCAALFTEGSFDFYFDRCLKDVDNSKGGDDKIEGPQVGTKFHRRYFPIESAPCLTSSTRAGAPVNIYEISMRLVSEDSSDRGIFRPEICNIRLAVLCGQTLPDAALLPFVLYPLFGTVEVRLKFVAKEVLAYYKSDFITRFQTEIIPDIVGCIKDWIVPDAVKDAEALMVAPINLHNGRQIDISLILSMLDKSPKKFDLYRCYDQVVMPMKKRSLKHCFVEQITELNPESLMPGLSQTFASFYQLQYGSAVKDLDQPVVCLSDANKRHFMFHPPQFSEDSPVKPTQKPKIYGIPEYLEVHPVPAHLWRQIQMLPFVLDRVRSYINIGAFREAFLSTLDGYENPTEQQSVSDVSPFDRCISSSCSDMSRLPSVADIQKAVTLVAANEEFNLERNEILGDSFLKFSVSVAVFSNQLYGHGSVGILTKLRSFLVGNGFLFEAGVRIGLPKLISGSKFEPWHCWLPPRMHFAQEHFEQQLCDLDQDWHSYCKDSLNVRPERLLLELMKDEELRSWLNGPKDEKSREHLFKVAAARMSNARLLPPNHTFLRLRQHVFISDKAIADSVESLLGLLLFHQGQDVAFRFLSFCGMNLCPNQPLDHLIVKSLSHDTQDRSSSDFSDDRPDDALWIKEDRFFPKNSLPQTVDAELEEQLESLLKLIKVDELEQRLSYTFEEKSFLVQACTHVSFYHNLTQSYERLEFLGDAILDYLITSHLITSFEHLSPGRITEIRSALVKNSSLARLSVDNKLFNHLLCNDETINNSICDYLKRESNRKDESDFWELPSMESIRLVRQLNSEDDSPEEELGVPKVLGDMVEALMAAIYLDCGRDLRVVWSVLRKLLPQMDQVVERCPRNEIALLMEKYPSKVHFDPPKTMDDGKFMVNVRLEVDANDTEKRLVFLGIGCNKKLAKLAAAKCAIWHLNEVKNHLIHYETDKFKVQKVG